MIQNIEEVGVFCFFVFCFQSKTFFLWSKSQEEVDMNKKKKNYVKKGREREKEQISCCF